MNTGGTTRTRLEALVCERRAQVSAQERRIEALTRRGVDTEPAELALFALRRNLQRALDDLEAETTARDRHP